MSATEKIRASIESRLRAIETEVTSLNATLKRMDAGEEVTAPPSNGNGRGGTGSRAPANANGRQRAVPRANGDRRSQPASTETIEQLLAATAGVSASELAGQLRADRTHVLALLKQMEADGNVRRTGARRATRWYVVTDEDRIRERAAELERRRAKPKR